MRKVAFMKNSLGVTSILTLLSACGGGGSDPYDNAQRYADLVGEAQVLSASFEDADVTDVTSMPDAGSFTYNGVAGFRTDTSDFEYIATNPSIVGDAQFLVNFETGNLSGTISKFVTSEGEAANGSVKISTGTIDDNLFTASMTGALEADGEAAAVNASMVGAFMDEGARGMLGFVEGTVADTSIWGVVGAAK